jgi:hypothetical protein
MDVILSFKKYIENYKIAFSYSILFIFLLFIIDPFISMFGGTLNLSYNLMNGHIVNILLVFLTVFVLTFIYSLLQTILIYKIGKDYSFAETIPFKKIKKVFYKLVRYNFSFFLIMFLISVILFDLNLLNNYITQIILLIIAVLLWFVPQVIVLENEDVLKAIYLSGLYFKRNWFHFITLFLCSFILILITSLLDILIPSIGGTIISSLFLIVFTIPFIEILKTEIYLNKYNLLKPRHQIR